MIVEQRSRTFMMTKIALCVALICISSYIIIPLPFTPVVISAQTLIINLTALILTPRQSLAALGIYLAIGICGVPVFSGGTAGIGKIFSPTGGFYIGFLAAAFLISLLKGKEGRFWRYTVVTIGVGIPVIYLFGVLFMCIFQQVDLRAALVGAVIPFLAGDIAKCIAASSLALVLNRALAHTRMAL